MYKIGDFVEFVEQPAATQPVPEFWYLLRVHPNREKRVMDGFERRGIAGYCPWFKKTIGFGRHYRRLVDRPVFPGIIFVPDFDAELDRLKVVDGVAQFIRFGETAARLKPDDISKVHHLTLALNVPASKRARMFRTGQLVRMAAGPFSFWIGRIERLDDAGRVRVLLDIFGRKTPVVIEEDDLESVD